ncbi:hypothetical protein F5Y11DRAFT_28293 [Daldinia sp. FL1419]|nr:hypothetical protein F5Y11DRAFT_28293 [Daldinia sp. FL1419]
MAFRAVPQPDPDPAQNSFASANASSSASAVDCPDYPDYRILNHSVSLGGPSTPGNPTSFNRNQQTFAGYQLPSIAVLGGRQYSNFNTFQEVGSYVPRYPSHLNHHHHHHYHYNHLNPNPNPNPSPTTGNYNHGQGRFDWTPARSEFPSTGSDSNLERLPRPRISLYAETHHSIAPLRTQEQRPSSSNDHNACTQLPQPNRSVPESNSDDYYLAAIANRDFSSPSLPPINSSPRPPPRPHPSDLPKPLEVGERMPATSTRRPRGNKEGLVDLTKEEPDFDSTSGVDPATPAMPPKKRAASFTNSGSASKKRRTTQSNSGRASKTKSKPNDPFSDDSYGGPAGSDNHEAIDLSNAAEVPSELMAPRVDNRIKIGKFQCVICMDNASYLTVTHCGHLFCSECLHSALHIDHMKKTCPVCRTKVDPKEKKGKNQKSYYDLELKIMTANKKGKRPAVPQ